MSRTRAGGQRAEFRTGLIYRISSTGRAIGVVAWLLFMACWLLYDFAIDYCFDSADASDAINSRLQKFASPGSPVHSSPQSTALSEAIRQNTPGNSQGFPLGLSWDRDTSSTKTTPAPSEWSGVTAWGQVYQQAGVPVSATNATDTVQIQNFMTYLHLTDGTWVRVQDQTQSGIGGAHYIADFSKGDANTAMAMQRLADGSISMAAPPSGYNDHFWPGLRATFTAGTVDGVFVEAQMKTSNPNASLVAQIGVDWWRSVTAQYAGLNVNNTAAGLNNWIKLTTQWQALYYSSLPPARLEADPPPSLLSPPSPRR